MGLLPTEHLFGRLSWTFFAAMLFISAPLSAITVTIGNFSGVSTNMSFAAGTWSPTGSPAQLDVLDLAAKLNLGDLTVTTNGAGDLIFNAGQFSYTVSAVRTLHLTAGGNISMSQIMLGGVAVHCVVNAGGNVTVDNPGWKTNGGDFTIASAVGVTLNGASVITGGGNFSCTSASLLTQNAGVLTEGGNANIVATGNVQILDGGFSTCGSSKNGNFTSQGVDFTMNFQDIRTAT